MSVLLGNTESTYSSPNKLPNIFIFRCIYSNTSEPKQYQKTKYELNSPLAN